MSKTITISDETWELIKDQVNKKEEQPEKGLTIYKTDGSVLFESTRNTTKEAVCEANLRGVNLHGADLRGVNLHGADLRGVNLTRANLHGADLTRANLHGVDLAEANLYGVDLAEANLHGADLTRADLTRANLYGADLTGADLIHAKFYGKTDLPQILKQSQVKDFLLALGFKVED